MSLTTTRTDAKKYRLRFYLWPLLMLIAMVVDMLSTHYMTPDLAMETNFFVAKLGFNWPQFLLAYTLGGFCELVLYTYHCNYFVYSKLPAINSVKQFMENYFTSATSTGLVGKLTSGLPPLWQRILAGLLNIAGYFIIRVSTLLKFFFAITNTIEGFWQRHYRYAYQGNGVYETFTETSPIEGFPELEKLIFRWIELEDIVEIDLFYLIVIAIDCGLAIFFIQFELHRMRRVVNREKASEKVPNRI